MCTVVFQGWENYCIAQSASILLQFVRRNNAALERNGNERWRVLRQKYGPHSWGFSPPLHGHHAWKTAAVSYSDVCGLHSRLDRTRQKRKTSPLFLIVSTSDKNNGETAPGNKRNDLACVPPMIPINGGSRCADSRLIKGRGY